MRLNCSEQFLLTLLTEEQVTLPAWEAVDHWHLTASASAVCLGPSPRLVRSHCNLQPPWDLHQISPPLPVGLRANVPWWEPKADQALAVLMGTWSRDIDSKRLQHVKK